MVQSYVVRSSDQLLLKVTLECSLSRNYAKVTKIAKNTRYNGPTVPRVQVVPLIYPGFQLASLTETATFVQVL